MKHLDPRTYLVMVGCVSALAMLYTDLKSIMCLLVVTLVILLVFCSNITGLLHFLRRMLIPFIGLFVIQILFDPVSGKVIVSQHGFEHISNAALENAAVVVIRIILIISIAYLLSDINPYDFVLGLVQWKVPFEIAYMVVMTIRFIPLFRDELINVVTAVQLRGINLRKVRVRQRLALCEALFVPVVFNALQRAETTAIAMEARGFRVCPTRTYLQKLVLKRKDILFIFTSLAVSFGFVGIKIF